MAARGDKAAQRDGHVGTCLCSLKRSSTQALRRTDLWGGRVRIYVRMLPYQPHPLAYFPELINERHPQVSSS
jgi:hypothetical protein